MKTIKDKTIKNAKGRENLKAFLVKLDAEDKRSRAINIKIDNRTDREICADMKENL